jgi:hypothetical protein
MASGSSHRPVVWGHSLLSISSILSTGNGACAVIVANSQTFGELVGGRWSVVSGRCQSVIRGDRD